MSEENNKSEFNERFETIEETLKYIADTQAKMEWLHKKEQTERQKFEEESRKRWQQTQKHLDYLSKLTGIAFEDIMFQEDKLQEAGQTLQRKKS
ncbi:MAG: hypothetical protein ACR2J3_13130 [Aridibacter sp.]